MLVPVLIKGDEEGDRRELGMSSACKGKAVKAEHALKFSLFSESSPGFFSLAFMTFSM